MDILYLYKSQLVFLLAFIAVYIVFDESSTYALYIKVC